MENYEELVKSELKGFRTFSSQRILINKVALEHTFDSVRFEFRNLCQFHCAAEGCTEADARVPLFEQSSSTKLIFCGTCQENPNKEECFYHEICSEGCRSEHHVLKSLPNNREQVFEISCTRRASLNS